MVFYERYLEARERKESVLCIGLDPALQSQRGVNVIPEGYGEDVLQFCLDIIEDTSDYACAYKINSQYVLYLMSLGELSELNNEIKSRGCISILDHKLGDINESNNVALHYTSRAGFDAITYSPFPGNITAAAESAHRYGLAIFILTLMSNPEAETFQKKAHIGDVPLYKEIACVSRDANADGLVIGATAHIQESDLEAIRDCSGQETVYLCPGVGEQTGDVNKLFRILGNNLLINVGRSIIYDQNPGEKAYEFKEILRG